MIQKKLSIYFLFFLSILLVNFDLNATITKDSKDDNNQTEESKDKSADEDTKPENLEECMMQAESMSDSKKCEKEFMKTIEEFIEEEELKKIDGFLDIYSNDDEYTNLGHLKKIKLVYIKLILRTLKEMKQIILQGHQLQILLKRL